ncbi:MAG: topoisomerase DNA-binding C4 zinc finger domain-containing protein [Rhodobacteraceae bacterium]|nr:topoisomerase DNA-binding C4 zinc finger domain-containing protein [Paracoccaceae bacterium]
MHPQKKAAICSPGRKSWSLWAEYPACPQCDDGWLIARKGRYRRFLGCVRFPKCMAKKKVVKPKGAKVR